ncbi:hypothetical protein [Dehalococcoides mccartyi]|uniref:Uncharacterized protein n=1 Tax=bioreactor metagenome TaxID=1076179 RepID=A0A644T444_9ZZZZ
MNNVNNILLKLIKQYQYSLRKAAFPCIYNVDKPKAHPYNKNDLMNQTSALSIRFQIYGKGSKFAFLFYSHLIKS